MTLDLKVFERGFFRNIQAVKLTRENLWDVHEWADSKPFHGPMANPDDKDFPITGLTVFTPTGRVKAEFGDWVYRTPNGDFRTYPEPEFLELFTPVVVCTHCGEWPAESVCCSSHERELCHGCYRRTHFVEICGVPVGDGRKCSKCQAEGLDPNARVR